MGRPVALSTVYRMRHRQGGRKLAPDQRHPKADPVAREAWKKLPEARTEISQAFPDTGCEIPGGAGVPNRSVPS